MACHGPAGGGNPGPAFPGGWPASSRPYVQRRLEEYRTGTTTQTDPHLFNIMASVAKPLTDEEIRFARQLRAGLPHQADASVATQ
jgi:cytochrome c553